MLRAGQPLLHLEARMENLAEKWEKSEKTRGRGRDARADEGKRKGLRWR